ncbi:MAG: YkgJ family cysteine cluster protein [Candidatus Delongbacteria bacterium]|nr:YkgJ family cysteine cluster protein [Candidatus Delongbacteria bacterium]
MSFYKHGIRFECKKCGNCCVGNGYVFIFPVDLERLIEKSGFNLEELQRTYLSTVDGYTVFRDGGSGACIFWDPIVKGCRIYEARPTQCRTFPFWKTLLYKKAKWDEGTKTCHGVGEGRLYSEEEIDEIKKLL